MNSLWRQLLSLKRRSFVFHASCLSHLLSCGPRGNRGNRPCDEEPSRQHCVRACGTVLVSLRAAFGGMRCSRGCADPLRHGPLRVHRTRQPVGCSRAVSGWVSQHVTIRVLCGHGYRLKTDRSLARAQAETLGNARRGESSSSSEEWHGRGIRPQTETRTACQRTRGLSLTGSG